MMWRAITLFVLLTPAVAGGCTGTSKIIKALAKDPATSCVIITEDSVYVRIKAKFARVVPGAGATRCNDDGSSTEPMPPK